jgi:hypothetical protein
MAFVQSPTAADAQASARMMIKGIAQRPSWANWAETSGLSRHMA